MTAPYPLVPSPPLILVVRLLTAAPGVVSKNVAIVPLKGVPAVALGLALEAVMGDAVTVAVEGAVVIAPQGR